MTLPSTERDHQAFEAAYRRIVYGGFVEGPHDMPMFARYDDGVYQIEDVQAAWQLAQALNSHARAEIVEMLRGEQQKLRPERGPEWHAIVVLKQAISRIEGTTP